VARFDDAGGKVLGELGAEGGPGAAVEEGDTVVGGFEEGEVQVLPHLLPFGAAVDERLDAAGEAP
jgi:hypothetical protein